MNQLRRDAAFARNPPFEVAIVRADFMPPPLSHWFKQTLLNIQFYRVKRVFFMSLRNKGYRGQNHLNESFLKTVWSLGGSL